MALVMPFFLHTLGVSLAFNRSREEEHRQLLSPTIDALPGLTIHLGQDGVKGTELVPR
jgi:hypothetical protein